MKSCVWDAFMRLLTGIYVNIMIDELTPFILVWQAKDVYYNFSARRALFLMSCLTKNSPWKFMPGHLKFYSYFLVDGSRLKLRFQVMILVCFIEGASDEPPLTV